jgi:hypothetical protein
MTEMNNGWVRSWGASPQAAHDGLGSLDGVTLADVTLRQVVRISGGGRRVRIRFTNEFGTAPVTIGAARVGLAAPGGGVDAGRALTFAGASAVTVPAGAPILSDPLDLPLPALTRLSISLYLPGRVETCTCHDPALDTGWTIPGNTVAAPTLPDNAEMLPVRALISAVEVFPDAPAKAIVVIGDSRVDGAGSTPDTNHSWPELLAERLTGYVSNQGISGNRMLNDGIGVAALARFDRDVLATPGLGYVVVSVGRRHHRLPPADRQGTRPRRAGLRHHDRALRRRGYLHTGGRERTPDGQRMDPRQRRLRRRTGLRRRLARPGPPQPHQ